MRFFNRLSEPVFLKESRAAEEQIRKLRELRPELNKEGQERLDQQIRRQEYGIAGEKNIIFELKNSHMPMYILHDICLRHGDLSAQIDFMVFTRKLCFVIECKNLYGDIEINESGDFIRTVELYGRRKKEGIYSPITQNQRHMQLMKQIRLDRCKNFIKRAAVERYFEDFNKSIIVLANPRSVLNARYAQKEVKGQVIRADRLVNTIRQMCQNSQEEERSDKRLLAWAEFYLELHAPEERDYLKQYDKYRIKREEEHGTEAKSYVDRIEELHEIGETEVLTESAKIVDWGELEEIEPDDGLEGWTELKEIDEDGLE